MNQISIFRLAETINSNSGCIPVSSGKTRVIISLRTSFTVRESSASRSIELRSAWLEVHIQVLVYYHTVVTWSYWFSCCTFSWSYSSRSTFLVDLISFSFLLSNSRFDSRPSTTCTDKTSVSNILLFMASFSSYLDEILKFRLLEDRSQYCNRINKQSTSRVHS